MSGEISTPTEEEKLLVWEEVTKKLAELKLKQMECTFYIPEDGRDPNPIWEEVSRSVWPSTQENQTDREALADVLMWACQDDVVLNACPNAGIVMSRMAQRLMGDSWMKRWLIDNYSPLRRRVNFHRREYGGFKRMFKKLFSSLR
jgi:hypothetical protein